MATALSIVESASLAATQPPRGSASALVKHAARQGATSLERGTLLPLPLLLDLEVLLRTRSFGRPAFRSAHPRTAQSDWYEAWLEDFASHATRVLGISARQFPSDGVDWDFAPLLAAQFASSPPQPAVLAEFRELAAGAALGDVL